MPTITPVVIRSSWDRDFNADPDAVFVTGYFGEPHINQFFGAGPSRTPYSFKALRIDGVIFQPDPNTRHSDDPRTRRWIPCRHQPPPEAVKELEHHSPERWE